MGDPAPLDPPVDSAQPSPLPDPTHLGALFRQMVPVEALEEFDVGHTSVFSPWVTTWLMVWQRSQGNASMSQAVAELLLGPTFDDLPACKRVRDLDISPNTSAYSQARSRLSGEVAVKVADLIFTAVTADLGNTWKGRPAYLVDGTSLSLPHQPELVEQFPPANNQYGASHWPVVRVVAAHELSSGFAPRWEWGPMYGPKALSETALAERLLPRLPAHSVLVDDRNFGIFSMTYAAIQAGHDVVVRMTEARFRAVTRGMEPSGPGEWRGSWRPSVSDRKSHPELPAEAEVHGRFVEIRLWHEGKEVVLLLFTTEMTATHEELAALYRKRWNIESDIKDIKIALCMSRLSGRSVDVVEKEMILGVVAYNLTLMVRRQAAEQARVPPRSLSFTRTLALVNAFARGVGSGDPETWGVRYERLLKAVGRCRLPNRPERNAPRELIPRRRGYPERKRTEAVNKGTVDKKS